MWQDLYCVYEICHFTFMSGKTAMVDIDMFIMSISAIDDFNMVSRNK